MAKSKRIRVKGYTMKRHGKEIKVKGYLKRRPHYHRKRKR